MPGPINLTPFGFTATESQVYGALLRLGPSTGYAVAHAARIARANTYGALEGLAGRAAAIRLPRRPGRYRAGDPPALIAPPPAGHGPAPDPVSPAPRDAREPPPPAGRGARGGRQSDPAARGAGGAPGGGRARRRAAAAVAARLAPRPGACDPGAPCRGRRARRGGYARRGRRPGGHAHDAAH